MMSAKRNQRPGSEGAALGAFLWHKILLAIVAVVVFFGLLEGSLAILGVRPQAEFDDPLVGFEGSGPLFEEMLVDDGRRVLVTSSAKRKFFNLQQFEAKKADRSFRIFCLGGSTTYGRPYDDRTSFCGWLRELLPVADPDREWEVVNAGGISYASYRVANLSRELAEYQPDLFIVYSGHNEFLEERTYGDFRRTPRFVRTAAAVLSRTRTGIAIGSLIALASGEDREPAAAGVLPADVRAKLDRSAGLALYTRDDDLQDDVLWHFRLSLERVVAIAERSGAEVMLVTPASNLRDFSPFKSQHTEGLNESERRRSQQLFASARSAASVERWEEALSSLETASALDPRHADLQYWRGQALLALDRESEADETLRLARDEDVCPLRALSPQIDIVAEVARENGAMLVDGVGIASAHARSALGSSIPGDESFLDHVHPTIEMHRLLAIEMIEAMTARGIVRPAEEWGPAAISRVADRVESGVDRKAHARALGNLAMTLSWAGKDEYSARKALQSLELGLDDPQYRSTALAIVARQFALDGEPEQAHSSYLAAVRANPGNPDVRMQLGMFLAGRDPEAATAYVLLASLMWSGNDETHRSLAFLQERRQRFGEALISLRNANRLRPRDAELSRQIAALEVRLPNWTEPPRQIRSERYPSGSARLVYQVRTDRPTALRDGVWTEWYPSGSLAAFAEYADGELVAPLIRWDEDGRRTSSVGRGTEREGNLPVGDR